MLRSLFNPEIPGDRPGIASSTERMILKQRSTRVDWPFMSILAAKPFRRIGAALVVLAAAIATLMVAAYPMYVIRPFREQDPVALIRALWFTMHNRMIVPVLFLVVLLLGLRAWQRAGWASRAALASAMGLALVAAISAWINPFELMMFHPFGAPQYVSIQQAKLDPSDMVIAINLGGESRAYPIREMGYHHIVNDRLHQLPIVVTY